MLPRLQATLPWGPWDQAVLWGKQWAQGPKEPARSSLLILRASVSAAGLTMPLVAGQQWSVGVLGRDARR